MRRLSATLVVLGAMYLMTALIMMMVYGFHHPELTDTQLRLKFLSMWKWWTPPLAAVLLGVILSRRKA